MANERLYQFPSKASPVPADIIFAGDSANAFDEVNITIAQLISAYPNLSGIAGLTLGANTYPYSNASAVLTAGTITALGVSLLADATIGAMQATLGYTATPTASIFAGWDANINLSANAFINGYRTTATAAGTTTLTVADTWQQFFTGSTTQTVLLPVTSTLVLGQSFYIVNNSSGAVTVQSSGGNNIQVMAANTTLLVTVILTSGTTATSWYADYNLQTALTLPLSIANGGTGVSSVTTAPTATSWAGWDANKNLSANSHIEGYATTATAAGTTTLTVGSEYSQFFTGTLTQNCVMPVTSTLVLGQQYYIVNNSSGVVTVQSSGGNTIVAMAASTAALVTCILTSGTTAASWYAEYEQASLILPLSMVNGGSGASLVGANNSLVYTSSTTTMALLATANSSVLGTDGSGNLAWLTTLPTNLALQTPASGILTNCTGYTVANLADAAWTDFSGTIGYTGFTGTPTTTIARYKKIGKTLFFLITMTGTSNATSFTITGMPGTSAVGTNTGSPVYQGENNGTSNYTVQFNMAASSTTLVMTLGNNASGWTASGTKGISFSGCYEIT